MYSNVKAEMARKNMSAVDLSEKTGIRYQTLVDKINGKSPVTVDEAKRIKSALQVSIPLEELFEPAS
jgi:transcriptional regulator with XRE-family HTH domain